MKTTTLYRYLIPLLFVAGAITYAPQEAEARRFCWNHCTYQTKCHTSTQCYNKQYCGFFRTRCYWTRVCSGGNFLDEGTQCRRQRVCRRTRSCSYRRYCRPTRRCYPRRTCRRICEQAPTRRNRYQQHAQPTHRAPSNWLDDMGEGNQPTHKAPTYKAPTYKAPTYKRPTYRKRPTRRYQPRKRPARRIFVKQQLPPPAIRLAKRTSPPAKTTNMAQIPGFLALVDNNDKANASDAPDNAAQLRAAAELKAKMARMKKQLAMLSRLREERLKGLKDLSRQESMRKQRLQRHEQKRQARLQRLEKQRKERLALLEQQLRAKETQLRSSNQDQVAKKQKWQQELAQLKAQRQQIAQQMDDKRKHLQSLQALARKAEARALRRRRIHKQLLSQEKSEIEALRTQRLAERKRLAYTRKLIKRRQKLLRERRKLLAAVKKNKTSKGKAQQRARRIAKKRLARIHREANKIKKTETKLNQKKQLAQTALNHFNKGSCSQAASYFKQAGREELGRKLEEFESKMRMGRGAYARRNTVIAIPLLERSLTLDLEIGGGNSRFTPTIRMMLANLYMIKGRIEMNGNDYPDAFLYFRTARRYRPKHKKVLEYLKQLRAIAQKYFQDALHKYKGNRRMQRRQLNNATRLLYPHDPLYQRAIKMLND